MPGRPPLCQDAWQLQTFRTYRQVLTGLFGVIFFSAQGRLLVSELKLLSRKVPKNYRTG